MTQFDDFDKLLKEKAQGDKCTIPSNLNDKINNILKNLPEKRAPKKMKLKVMLIAAAIAAMSITTVFAGGAPHIKKLTNDFVSYFKGTENCKYDSDMPLFNTFNSSIGASITDKNIKFTVDNIAADDNFINIFYTIESKTPINMNFTDENELFKAFLSAPFLDLKINGKNTTIGNHNDIDAYFKSPKVLKVMKRFNVSQSDLPVKFNLEISAKEIFNTKGNWSILTSVDKSNIKVKSTTVKPDIKASIKLGKYKHKINIDKVCISPFSSQIVISEHVKDNNLFDTFALYDDKGRVLDVLNTDETTASNLFKTTNSFEFIKAKEDTKSITLVPINFTEKGKAKIEKAKIKNLPISIKTCNTGSRVIDKIEFNKNVIRISYHNDGVVLWDPAFIFYDKNDNELNFDFGENTSVNRATGEFTQTLESSNKNEDFSKISEIGTFTGNENLDLLKDQGIKIKLK
ncbi:DUF4179 domain-containing protein [Haloimpatiens sp. FM7315]|uniref:DUF4179 domain-containing protein n=1 Tax=Haloimpatiens sp. FM7315 TaxID=3298609 RepID=UPI0035A2CB62